MSIQERLKTIQDSIYQAAASCGRRPTDIRLVAVSKTHPAQTIESVYTLGHKTFGENYAEELSDKCSQLKHLSDVHWVFIGQLQSNKIQKIVKCASEIQSVATEKHARYIQRYAAEFGKNNFPVWIVVNAAEEEKKQGVPLGQVTALSSFIIKECPHLSLQGIMAIPPPEYSDAAYTKGNQANIPELYKTLRKVASTTGQGKLSLGMSGDLHIAIAAGSDCVRIGTALFGERPQKQDS